jgi:hypothetical protein
MGWAGAHNGGAHPNKTMYWDRFDICAAHWMFAMLWHDGQGSATYAKFSQLERLRFSPAPRWAEPADLEANAREIYRQLVVTRCGLHSTAPA